MPTPTTPADKVPAHALWVELSTRITTQRLHFRSGDEETAARSIYTLFAKTRSLMEAHPDARAFQEVAERMLNQIIRPYTARWHGWMVPDPKLKDKDGQPLTKFRDPQLRRKFRGELRELQPQLLGCQHAFDLMRLNLPQNADGETVRSLAAPDDCMLEKLTRHCTGTEPKADLGAPLKAGIQPQVWLEDRFTGALPAAEIDRRERIFVNRRRNPGSDASDAPVENAIGLALSGGGIKSATFCLGVVQELAKRGILPQVDYLSTVSGGGYCGSFISAFLGTAINTQKSAVERVREAFLAQPEGTESRAVRHLRNHSQYLLNGGTFGKLNMAGLMATGVLANLLMVLPVPLCLALLLWLLNLAGFWGSVWSASDTMLPTWDSGAGRLFMIVGLVLAGAWFLMPGVQRWTNRSKPGESGARFRSVWELATLLLAVLAAFTGLLFAWPCVIKSYLSAREWFGSQLQGLAPTEKTMAAISGTIPMLLAASGYIFRTGWLKKLLMNAFMISGPLFYGFIILYVSVRLGMGAGEEWNAGIVAAVTLLWLLWSLFMVNLNTLSLHGYYRARLCECYLAVPGKPQLSWWGKMRAKLWEGYVPETETTFGTVQHIKLSSIGESGAAPYHLLNAIVNLPASKNRNLRGRGGDFFVMSREVCGSPVTGYVETKRLEEADPRFDLGAAMAISAAAVNTNMGWRTEGGIGSFRFLLTLLNARLGYWLPNFRLAEKGKDGSPLPVKNRSIGSAYLLAEMGGRIQENMNHLNVSDGGHIENLGVYELLRRKCKFIISVDGGANRDVVGGDLQRLERYASIDFGIRMEYDLAELQPDEEGVCRSNSILVKIHYSDTETGWLIYLRPGITGNEPAYLIDHWKQNPVFPYESILDQIFEEEQFEGYRCVGNSAMASLFREDLGTDSNGLSVQTWFEHLAARLLPDNDEAFRKQA